MRHESFHLTSLKSPLRLAGLLFVPFCVRHEGSLFSSFSSTVVSFDFFLFHGVTATFVAPLFPSSFSSPSPFHPLFLPYSRLRLSSIIGTREREKEKYRGRRINLSLLLFISTPSIHFFFLFFFFSSALSPLSTLLHTLLVPFVSNE